MATGKMLARERRRARLAACCLSASAFAIASNAHADVDFEPSVTVGFAHTDNLTLQKTDTQSETIYELIPQFRFSQESPRVSSSASYRVEGYRYKSVGADEVYNLLDGSLRVAADPDNFWFDLGVSKDQAIRDPAAPLATSNLPITSNRLDRDYAFFGPRFVYPLGESVTVDTWVRRTRVRFDTPDDSVTFARDYDVDAVNFSLDNYAKEHGFTWATRYTSDKTEYDRASSYEFRQASAQIGAWLGRRARMFVSGGKESPWDEPLTPDLQDTFWELGFATRDNERFNAELAAGERSYGSSHRATLGMMFRHGSLQYQYMDQPETQRYDPYSGGFTEYSTSSGQPTAGGFAASPGELGNPIDLLTRHQTPERYRLRLSGVTLGFEFQRTNLSIGMWDESRDDRLGLDGTTLPGQDQVTAMASASRHFGARTSLAVTLEKTETDLSPTNQIVLERATVTTSYELGPRTAVSLVYTYSSEVSDQTNVGFEGFGYKAQTIELLLTRTFNTGPRTNNNGGGGNDNGPRANNTNNNAASANR